MTNLSVRNVNSSNEAGGGDIQLSYVDLMRGQINKTRRRMIFNWPGQNFTSEEHT